MLKYLLAIVFLSGCSTTGQKIAVDDTTHLPPTISTPSDKPLSVVPSDFSKFLNEKIATKTMRAMAQSCPLPVSSVSAYNGITFTFAQPTVCVKSLMGEPICKAPFVVTGVTPAYVVSGGVSRNGHMFNIPNHTAGQSFDSRAIEPFSPPPAFPISFNNVGDALVAVKSKPVGYSPGTFFDGQTDNQPTESNAVLTADSEARVCGAQPFYNVTTLMRRPPAGDKSLAYDLSDFLRILPIPTLPVWPGISSNLANYSVGSYGMQSWENWGVQGHFPSDKKMSYGNYRAARQGERMMIALMDIPFEPRLVILLGLAQDAIDSAGAFLGGATYTANGGHNSGPHLAMVKYLGWLTGDERFKQKGPITAANKRFGEQFHLEVGTNYYVPSHTVNYNAFWDGAWSTEPSPALKPVSQYNDSDKRKISYMLCCGAMNWQAGYLALHILGQLDPANSETDRRVMQWIKQYREPYSPAWNDALYSIGASTLPGWWGQGQAVSNYYWPYFGW